MKIVNFGSMNIDYVYKVDSFVKAGETKKAENREVFCGGKGLNQSIACSKAGLDTYHAAYYGKEATLLVDKLNAYDVHTVLLRETEQESGHAIIQVDMAGENCILLYSGTNSLYNAEYIDEVFSRFSKNDIVLLQNETNMVGYIIGKAVEKGMRIAFNAAPFTPEVKGYPIEKVTWLFVNEIEGGALSGETEYDRMAERLHEMYPNTEVILTLGKEGSIHISLEGLCRASAKKVKVVDTTAAGDAFTGYYLMGAVNNVGVKNALAMATAASAQTVTCEGAADTIPWLDELDLPEVETK